MIAFVRGNSKDANASDFMKGWVAGHMHTKEGGTPLTGSLEFEIKLWHYPGPIDYGKKSFGGTEFVVIYGGVLRFELEQEMDGKIEKEVVVIHGEHHEYVIFPSGIKKTVVVVEAPAFGVTVRWPSKPGVNKVLG